MDWTHNATETKSDNRALSSAQLPVALSRGCSTSLVREKHLLAPCGHPRHLCHCRLFSVYERWIVGGTRYCLHLSKLAMASACTRQLMRAPARTRYPPPICRHARLSIQSRTFSSSRASYDKQNFHRKESFRSRLNSALKNTKIKWEPIPIALGIGFLGAFQIYRIQRREKHTQAENNDEGAVDQQGRPKKRERIRPSGPWSAVRATNPVLHTNSSVGVSRSCLRCL